jgi:hypothetical protein
VEEGATQHRLESMKKKLTVTVKKTIVKKLMSVFLWEGTIFANGCRTVDVVDSFSINFFSRFSRFAVFMFAHSYVILIRTIGNKAIILDILLMLCVMRNLVQLNSKK